MQTVKGSACVSSVGEGVPRSRTSLQRLFRSCTVISEEHRLLALRVPAVCRNYFLIAVTAPECCRGLPATPGWQPAPPQTQDERNVARIFQVRRYLVIPTVSRGISSIKIARDVSTSLGTTVTARNLARRRLSMSKPISRPRMGDK